MAFPKTYSDAEFMAAVARFIEPHRKHPGKGATKSIFPLREYDPMNVPQVLLFALEPFPTSGTPTAIPCAMVIGYNDSYVGVRETIYPQRVYATYSGGALSWSVSIGFTGGQDVMIPMEIPKPGISTFADEYRRLWPLFASGRFELYPQIVDLQMRAMAAGFTWDQVIKAAGGGGTKGSKGIIESGVEKEIDAFVDQFNRRPVAFPVGGAYGSLGIMQSGPPTDFEIGSSLGSSPDPASGIKTPFGETGGSPGVITSPGPIPPSVKPLIDSKFPPVEFSPNVFLSLTEMARRVEQSMLWQADTLYRTALQAYDLAKQNWEYNKANNSRSRAPKPDFYAVLDVIRAASGIDETQWLMLEYYVHRVAEAYPAPDDVYLPKPQKT
jgi:hypothetical protein